MIETDPAPGPLDFRTLDFDRLWRGRAKTIDVERRIVLESFKGLDLRRILEVGPGSGRIASVLLAEGQEYVGVDITLDFLAHLKDRWADRGTWVGADLRQLPFREGMFSGVVAVRVLDFLPDPLVALRELHRVLTPGGWLLLSYFSAGSVARRWDGVMKRIRDPADPAGRRSGGARPTRAEFRRMAEEAGFLWGGERGTGLEDLRVLRRLPATTFVGLSRGLGRSGWLPHHFVLLRRAGVPPTRITPLEEGLICPDCGSALVAGGPRSFAPADCPTCGRARSGAGGVLDLRPRSGLDLDDSTGTVQVRAG